MGAYIDKDGNPQEDRRQDDSMPSWAYEIVSDIRDIKTTLLYKFQNYDEVCRNLARLEDKVEKDIPAIKSKLESHDARFSGYDKAVFWLFTAIGAGLIAAALRSIGVI